MNNTQKVARIEATLSDGTRVDAVLTVAVVLFNEEDLHSAIRTIVPARKKHIAITTAIAYGQDGKAIALPTADDIKIKAEQDYRAKLQAEMDEAMEFAKKALEELDGKTPKEETTMNNDNKAFFDKEFDAAVEDLEKTVEEAVNDLKGAKAQQYFKKLINASDKEVYDTLLDSINGAVHNSRIAVSTRTRLRGHMNELKAKTATILENTETTKQQAVMAKLKLMIAVFVRKTLAVLEGTTAFVFDATAILGVMVTRIACTTAKEVWHASHAIAVAFKGDIIDYVKQA